MAAIGTALVAVAAAIALRQRRATTCTRHSRLAGRCAWMVAGLSVAAGIWLIGVD